MLNHKQTLPRRMRFHLLALAGSIIVFGMAANGATPLRIDIQSVTIEARTVWLQPAVRIVALDEAQNQVTYSGAGSFVVSMIGAGPFSISRTISTDCLRGTQVGYSSAVSWGFFTITEGHSDPIGLFATTPRKPESFIRTGSAGLRGRFEYWTEQQGLVAFDDDVVLEGSYQAFLSNRNFMDGRNVELTRMLYTLKKPES